MVIRPRRRAATEPPTPAAHRHLYYYFESLTGSSRVSSWRRLSLPRLPEHS
ncbi:hypothetical protein ABH924_003644 [Arthrobacter sp. GAS37]